MSENEKDEREEELERFNLGSKRADRNGIQCHTTGGTTDPRVYFYTMAPGWDGGHG